MRYLLKYLSVSARFSSNYQNKHLKPLGLNSGQHFYVLHICEQPGITQDNLLRITYVNPSNITRALSQLEKKGYVTRSQSTEDKRTWHLYPTKKALENYDRILAILADCGEQLLTSFSKKEKELFQPLLKKLYENVTSVKEVSDSE